MFTVVEDKSWFGNFEGNIKFHWQSDAQEFRSVVDRLVDSVQVHHGGPDRLIQVQGAHLRPGELCLYDRDGSRVLESCVRRGAGKSEYVDAGPLTVKVPDDVPVILDPVLYLSGVSDHWGHFLTEGISRLWALDSPEFRDAKYLSNLPYPGDGPVRDYLHALNVTSARFLHFDHPVRIANCWVPAASFANRAEAYSIHLNPSRAVALAAWDGEGVPPTAQPVYLSRSRLLTGSGRRIRRELELEEALSRFGIRIVYPEHLTLSQQVAMFNAHRIFIGCLGSAFHGVCLALAPREITTHVLCEIRPNPNYLMFDVILGCTSNYVQALFPTPGKPQVFPDLDLTVDVGSVLEYLEASGCI